VLLEKAEDDERSMGGPTRMNQRRSRSFLRWISKIEEANLYRIANAVLRSSHFTVILVACNNINRFTVLSTKGLIGAAEKQKWASQRADLVFDQTLQKLYQGNCRLAHAFSRLSRTS